MSWRKIASFRVRKLTVLVLQDDFSGRENAISYEKNVVFNTLRDQKKKKHDRFWPKMTAETVFFSFLMASFLPKKSEITEFNLCI